MSKKIIDNKELMKEWNYGKNKKINLEDITYGSTRKVWWICERGHEWEATPNNRHKGTGCPYCNNKKLLSGFNDLKTINPFLSNEWNYEKNGNLLPSEVFPKSHNKVWWKCSECGYEWEAQIKSRNVGTGCPKCSLRKNK